MQNAAPERKPGVTPTEFQEIWDRALKKYRDNLPPELSHIDLVDQARLNQIDHLEDLILHLQHDSADFDSDTGRGSTHSAVLHDTFSGLESLVKIFGGAAGAAFPPCSQALGAISVLISAGKGVTNAFDAISGLFTRLKAFLGRVQVLTETIMDPPLQEIVVGMLVCTLEICSLATRKAHRAGRSDELAELEKKERDGKVHFNLSSRLTRAREVVASRVSQFATQLFMGGDSDIDGAVGKLKRLVEEELSMTTALTKRDTTEIKTVAVEIRDLTVEIVPVTLQIQRDTGETKFRVIEIQQSVTNIESGVTELRENIQRVEMGVTFTSTEVQASSARVEAGVSKVTLGAERVEAVATDLKSGQRKQEAQQSEVLKQIANLTQKFDDSSRSPRPANKTRERSLKQSQQLYLLKPPAENANLYRKFKDRVKGTSDWVLDNPMVHQWLNRSAAPVIVISGESGLGKSFLAARVIEELERRQKDADSTIPTSWAYFFCRKTPKELSSTSKLLKSLAFQIVEDDSLYNEYVNSDSRMQVLQKSPDDTTVLWNTFFAGFFEERRGNSTMLVIDGLDTSEGNSPQLEELCEAFRQRSTRDSKWTLPNVQLMLFADPDAAEVLTNLFGHSISHLVLDSSHTQNDIDLVLKNAWAHKVIPRQLQKAVRQTVRENCGGNFLRASLILEEATSLSREDDIWALLSRPPKDVAGATSLMLQRLARQLDAHGHEDLVDMLAWMSCAHRPLRLSELDAILTIRSSEGCRLIDLKERITLRFSALFTLSTNNSWSDTLAEDKIRNRLRIDDKDIVISNAPEIDSKPNGEDTKETDNDDDSSEEDDTEQRLASMENIEIRLVSTIVDPVTAARTSGLTSENLQCKTLLGCLGAICDPPDKVNRFAAQSALRYCGLYLPEHLSDVDITEVEARKTREVVRLLLKMLRDDEVIDRWISVASLSMIGDLLLDEVFEKNLLSWLRSRDLQGRLPQADLKWISEVDISPTSVLFKAVAQGHARRWLIANDGWTDANFGFLNAYIGKVAFLTATRTDSTNDEAADSNEDAEATDLSEAWQNYALATATAARIVEVAKWAGFEDNAQWYRRVGDALHQGENYQVAIEMYQKAIDIEPADPVALYCMGMVYGDWSFISGDVDFFRLVGQGIVCMEKATELRQQRSSQSGLDSDTKLAEDKAYLDCKVQLGILYKAAKREVDLVKIYDEMVLDWEKQELSAHNLPKMFAAYSYLRMLVGQLRDDEAVELLEKIVNHPQSATTDYYNLYTWIKELAPELFQLAQRTKRFSLLDIFWTKAVQVAARRGPDGETSVMRWYHAHGLARLRPDRRAEAMAMLKKITQDPEVSSPADTEHWVAAVAEKELARLLLDAALEARDHDRWAEVHGHFQGLTALVQPVEEDSPDAGDCALYLAAWYKLHRRFRQAKEIVKPLLEYYLDLLYDPDPDNDFLAWTRVHNAMLAVGDVDRARTSYELLGSTFVFGNHSRIVTFDVEEGDTDGSEDDGGDSVSESDEEEEHQPSDVDTAPTATEPEPTTTQIVIKATDTNLQESASTVPDANHVGNVETTALTSVAIETTNLTVSAVTEGEPQPPNADGSAEAPETEDPFQLNKGYTCDSSCFQEMRFDQPLYRCTYCITDLCEACYERIKAGDRGDFAVCNSTHEWMRFEPIEKLPEGMIRVEGKMVSVRDWLDALADEFGIARRGAVEDVEGEEGKGERGENEVVARGDVGKKKVEGDGVVTEAGEGQEGEGKEVVGTEVEGKEHEGKEDEGKEGKGKEVVDTESEGKDALNGATGDTEGKGGAQNTGEKNEEQAKTEISSVMDSEKTNGQAMPGAEKEAPRIESATVNSG